MSERREQRYPSDAIVEPDRRPKDAPERKLGDFEVPPGVIRLGLVALAIGVCVALVALALLDLIGLITHLVYTGTLDTRISQPDITPLGPLSVLVPVAGGLVVGLMARLGSERIRGHGIPEAMETILLRGSRMEPRLAVLKPLSSAISIGTGGPFGAEGPIIVTGGALGSIFGQLLHLTAAERRALLVAGAAAGMTAVFGTPVAAVLLAVELLLFEWRPRSMIPVALAAGTAETVREALVHYSLIRPVPLFPMAHSGAMPSSMIAGAALVGLAGGMLAWAMTCCVYGAEDLFGRLPLHWTWWPALGGVVVGLGGLLDPRALGVGYEAIGAELAGRLAVGTLLALLLVKLAIWSVALGSNTSGGILAPLLMLGGALGGLLGAGLGGAGEGTWALLGLAAALAGVTRSPFTSIVFAVELTHDVGSLFVLLVACTLAHLVSVLVLKRSILTEKVARRGHHVTREYQIDPLQALLVRDVMSSGEAPLDHDASGATVAHPDETLRVVADRMVLTGSGMIPVVERADRTATVGYVGPLDLLRAHERVLVEERHRERPLDPRRIALGLAARRRSRERAPESVS
jgi:chloride channel protein, CIC family